MKRLLNDFKFGFKNPDEVVQEIEEMYKKQHSVYFVCGSLCTIIIMLIVNFLIK